MWHMQEGDRAMTQAEWALFRTGLDLFVSAIEEERVFQTEDAETGVTAFDRLTYEQKILLLADVAQAMREPEAPMLDLTAFSEGAVAAVFAVIIALVRDEIKKRKGSTKIRELLLAVFADSEDFAGELPEPTNRKWEEWVLLLDCFEETILWDNDFAAEHHYLDLPPDEAKEKLKMMGILPDYFLAIPKEPTTAELAAARETLSRLICDP